MKLRWRVFALCLPMLLLIAACQKAEEEATPTPDQNSIEAASTLFAQPSANEGAVTPPPATDDNVEIGLNRTIARMEQGVLDADLDTYMQYVWQQDPVFLADHTGWARDWVAHPLEIFTIDLFNIQTPEPDTAQARMTIRWRIEGRTDEGSAGGATVTARFYKVDDRWLFAGESWKTEELEGMTLSYFADNTINIASQASVMLDYLPSIYTGVTHEFDYVPEDTIHIKLYESPITLRNFTRISMPDITHWNQPGESIKVPLTPNGTAPYEPDMGRELTRYLLYSIADGNADAYPWWMEQGIVEFGGERFSTLSQRNRILRGTAALSLAPPNAEEQLFDWSALEQEPDGLEEIKQIAIDQSFALVHFITETYGEDARNAWIRGVASGKDVDAATQEHLGVSLDELDAAWRAWLPQQL